MMTQSIQLVGSGLGSDRVQLVGPTSPFADNLNPVESAAGKFFGSAMFFVVGSALGYILGSELQHRRKKG